MSEGGLATKWKIFRAVNYVQVLAGAGLVITIVVRTSSYSFDNLQGALFFLLFTVGFSIFTANGLSNIYLIERFLPDQLPPRAALRANLVFYILQLILSVLLIIGTIAAFVDVLDRRSYDDAVPFVILSAFTTLCCTSIPIWFLQVRLRRTLKKNHYNSFDQFLGGAEEETGEEL